MPTEPGEINSVISFQICISCCDLSYCNIESPTNATNAIYSRKRRAKSKSKRKRPGRNGVDAAMRLYGPSLLWLPASLFYAYHCWGSSNITKFAHAKRTARKSRNRDGIVATNRTAWLTPPSPFDRMLFSVIPSVASHSPKLLMKNWRRRNNSDQILRQTSADGRTIYRARIFRTRRTNLDDDYRPII